MSQSGPMSSTGSGGAGIESLTGNSGGAVFPNGAFNIDLIGNNSSGIDVVGTSASSLLTIIGLSASQIQVGTLRFSTDAETILYVEADTAISPSTLSSGFASPNPIGSTSPNTGSFTEVSVDNLLIDGNTISSTDTNGVINIFPDGTGGVVINPNLTVGNTVQNVTDTINGSSIDSVLSVESSGNTDLGGIIDHRHSDTAAFGSHWISLRSRGDHSTPTIVQNNDAVSRILMGAYDGTDYAQCAEIRVSVDGTPGANDMPGRIVFFTSPDGSQTPTEALRISSNQTSIFSGVVETRGRVIDITSLTDADSPYTVLANEYYFSCDVSSGTLSILLPNSPDTGTVYVVKDSGGDAATNLINVTTVGGVVTIDGATFANLNTNYESLQFVFNGTSYEVF